MIRIIFSVVLLVVVAIAHAPRLEGITREALRLFQFVQMSDLVVLGTVTDGARALVRIDETLKGTRFGQVIEVVDFVDSFSSVRNQRPLVTGTQELMFLRKKGSAYGPVYDQEGRWLVRDGNVVNTPSLVMPAALTEFRRAIRSLVRLQAAVAVGPPDATAAYVEGLQSSDARVRHWAALTGYREIRQPSGALVDAYLAAWATGDAEVRYGVAAAVRQWKVTRAAPMLANTLRDASASDRAIAASALGSTGDRSYATLLRATASSDSSETVRSSAYLGLTYLLNEESIPDLLAGAKDKSPRVRMAVARYAYNMANTSEQLRASSRRVLSMLLKDPSPDIRRVAHNYLTQLKPVR